MDRMEEYQNNYKKIKNKERHQKSYRLEQKYGITLDDYYDMLKEQDGVCAICGKLNDDENIALSVDHDHETGEVRGLLCRRCNSALAMVRDDPYIVYCMGRYLDKHYDDR